MSTREEQPEFDGGTPGASARGEHRRRKANRERLVRERHPRLGGLMLALGDARQHETAWIRGAGGEEHVARRWAKCLNDGVLVLHDRRIPGSRANIDHIAVAPSGVWVIDTKRCKGKVAVSNSLFRPAKLTIAGRDRSKLTEGLAKQVALVEEAMRRVGPGVPVRGALCFVDADLPLVGKLTFAGFPLLYAKRLAKRINAKGPLVAELVPVVAGDLARRFPAA